MKNFIFKLTSIFFTKQFIKFVAIGIINTFNGVIFSYIYSNIFNEEIGFILGYASGLIISYILNSYITFREKLEIRRLIKFTLSYIPNFLIQYLSVAIILRILNWDKLIAYILAAVIGVPITYLFMKFFAFSSKR